MEIAPEGYQVSAVEDWVRAEVPELPVDVAREDGVEVAPVLLFVPLRGHQQRGPLSDLDWPVSLPRIAHYGPCHDHCQ